MVSIKGQICITLKIDLLQKLEDYSKKYEITKSKIISNALKDYFESNERTNEIKKEDEKDGDNLRGRKEV